MDSRANSERTGISPESVRVRSGLHEGAVSPLKDEIAAVVGSANDCDIRLADEHVQPHHCVLLKSGDQIWIRSIDGELTVAGGNLSNGRTLPLEDQQLVNLQGSSVSFSVDFTKPEVSIPNADQEIISAQSNPTRRLMILCTALLLSGALYGYRVSNDDSHNKSALTSPQIVLDQMGLTGKIEYIESQSATTKSVLRGIITRQEAKALKQKLGDAYISLSWEISEVSEILNSVENVFRINGYSAQLEYLGDAEVRVLNLNKDDPGVIKVTEHAYADVADLKKLSFSDSNNGAPTDNSPSLYALLPGKRLTTIVDGNTAYVATEDGSRYFVGSVLPGGSQIQTINESGVQVDFNGTLTWMRF